MRNPEQVLDEVYTFVGVECAKYCPLPAGMQVRCICPVCNGPIHCCARGGDGTRALSLVQNEYGGRAMHPTVKAKLREYFRESNQRLYQMLGRDFRWEKDETDV